MWDLFVYIVILAAFVRFLSIMFHPTRNEKDKEEDNEK